MTVLNDKYNMASNNRNTGRLDVIMEYCVNEYIKIILDPIKHTAEGYVTNTEKKTGIKVPYTNLEKIRRQGAIFQHG